MTAVTGDRQADGATTRDSRGEAGHAHHDHAGHGHAHEQHGHDDHGHSHAHAHTHAHTHAGPTERATLQPQTPGFSLMRASLGGRLAIATGIIAMLWAAIAGVLWA